MKLTSKQRNELKILRYWIPSNLAHKRLTQKQVDKFFAWSDKGIKHGENIISPPWTGFKALYWAKNRRDLQIASYLEDWGSTMNAWSFDDMPKHIRIDIAKRMKKPAIISKESLNE